MKTKLKSLSLKKPKMLQKVTPAASKTSKMSLQGRTGATKWLQPLQAERALKPAVNYLLKKNCKKIILGCTEIPIAIFAYKSFKKVKESKIFIDPNLLLAEVSMRRYR